jgi:hypothetical protein
MHFLPLFSGDSIYPLKNWKNGFSSTRLIPLRRKRIMLQTKCQWSHKKEFYFPKICFRFPGKSGGRMVTTHNSTILSDFIKMLLFVARKEEADDTMSDAEERK